MRIARLALIVALLTAVPRHASAVDALFDAYWEWQLRAYPTWATYLGDHRYGDRLTDLSATAIASRLDTIRAYHDAILAADLDPTDSDRRLSAQLFERSLREKLDAARFRAEWLPISQQSGIHISFPQLGDVQPMTSDADARAYRARLEAFQLQVEQVIANMRAGMAAGIVAFRGNMDGVVPQMRSQVVDDATTSAFYAPVTKLPADVRSAHAIDIERAIRDHVVPAFAGFADFVEHEYLPACRTEPGVWALPDGAERYAHDARRYTTTDMTPDAIHALGLEHMARIRREMDAVRQQVGFDGDLDAFLVHLRTSPEFYFTDPDDLVEGFRAILADIDAELPRLFGRLPKASYDLKVMEPFRAAAAPAAYYYSPPQDGSRPGYFYVNTYKLDTRPTYTMESLAYHEAVPGHHLQIALQQELDDLPAFRRHGGYTAFTEGWGLYSESLPKEVGAYTDPYSEFGRLTFEAWRAARLVVDTGIHAHGWTREQAIDYLTKNTALGEHDIRSEIDRYIARPGQALAYKIGELEIRALRSEAETALGDAFDVRAFHDRLLADGALPLDVLRSVMRSWLEEQRPSAAQH